MATKKNEEQIMKETIKRVFSEGILYKVDAAGWWAHSTKCRETEVLQPVDGELAKDGQKPMKGIKPLLNPKLLAPIRSMRGYGERIIKKNSFPFLGLRGVYFKPKAFISMTEEELVETKNNHDALVMDLNKNLPKYKREWQKQIGKFYDDELYPKDMRSKFRFNWSKFVITPPDKELKVLSDKEYKEEVKKQTEQLKRFMDSALGILANQFVDMVGRLSTKLDKGKPVGKRYLESWAEFARTFKTMNVTGHKPLEAIVTRMDNMIGNKSAEDFKEDKFRSMFSKQVSKVVKSFDTLSKSDDSLNRALEF